MGSLGASARCGREESWLHSRAFSRRHKYGLRSQLWPCSGVLSVPFSRAARHLAEVARARPIHEVGESNGSNASFNSLPKGETTLVQELTSKQIEF